MGMNGPVALNLKAVEYVMDILGVEDKLTCSDRVVSLWAELRSEEIEMERVRRSVNKDR